ncbi:MAG: response regulator [Fibrobacteria bacterium]|nr:response regulator [Fibrobacteria bacterium]
MSKERILVVEDGSLVAMDMERQLQERGYQVINTVSNGKDAVHQALKHKPDLILMDIMLDGDMDGIQAADQILQQIDIPIIYLTAYADEQILKRAKATCPCGYLIKPYVEENLHATIQMTLSRYAREKSHQKKSKWLSEGLNTINDGVIMTDIKHCVTFMNKAAKIFTGFETDSITGKDVHDVLHIAGPNSPSEMDSPSITAINSESESEIPSCALLNTNDNKTALVTINAKPVKTEEGLLIGAVITIQALSSDETSATQSVDAGSERGDSPLRKRSQQSERLDDKDILISQQALPEEAIENYSCECSNYFDLFSDALKQNNNRAFEYLSETLLSSMRRFKTTCSKIKKSVQSLPDSNNSKILVEHSLNNLKKALSRAVEELRIFTDNHKNDSTSNTTVTSETLFDWSATSYHLNLINNSAMPLSDIIDLFLKDTPELLNNLEIALQSDMDDRKLLHCYSLAGAADTMDAYTLRGMAILATMASLLDFHKESEYILQQLYIAFDELKTVFKDYR